MCRTSVAIFFFIFYRNFLKGAFAPDSALFNSVLKTYISVSGVEWVPETVCVFDGLQNVLEHVTAWYEERLNSEVAGALLREEYKTEKLSGSAPMSEPEFAVSSAQQPVKINPVPEGLTIFEAEPIVDRKSSFVGRACVITDPAQVPLILAHISSDRRVARAAHPIINAWRCQIGNVLHQGMCVILTLNVSLSKTTTTTVRLRQGVVLPICYRF